MKTETPLKTLRGFNAGWHFRCQIFNADKGYKLAITCMNDPCNDNKPEACDDRYITNLKHADSEFKDAIAVQLKFFNQVLGIAKSPKPEFASMAEAENE